MKTPLITTCIAACLILGAATARADDTRDRKQNETKLRAPDSKFVHDAAEGGMMEVKMGKLGVEKAQSQGVKTFAQKIVDDHTKANAELTQLAQSKGVTLPTSSDDQDLKHFKMLTDKNSADFDKAYVMHMVKDHEKDIKEFEKEAQKGSDPEIKAFAQKCLPVLREHLEMARSLSGSKATTSRTVTDPSGAAAPHSSANDSTGNATGQASGANASQNNPDSRAPGSAQTR